MASRPYLQTYTTGGGSGKIVRAYYSKHLMEDNFRLTKGTLIVLVKPIYRWRGERINAHIFLWFLEVLFFRYLLRKVKDHGLSAQKVAKKLLKMMGSD